MGATLNDGSDLLIAYASQTGHAAEIAEYTALLFKGHWRTQTLPLNKLDAPLLEQSKQVLFVVSTYGEGDPPDMAARFAHRYLNARNQNIDLSHLHYAVLALGDKHYRHFCGFGHLLFNQLRNYDAQPLFDIIEMDRDDPAALTQWQQRLAKFVGGALEPVEVQPRYEAIHLRQRVCLNAGSVGAPVFRLGFSLKENIEQRFWQAGDIVSILPGNAPEELAEFLDELNLDGQEVVRDGSITISLAEALLYRDIPRTSAGRRALHGLPSQEITQRLQLLPARDYSIASIPEDGKLELLVREMRHPDGRLGLGSGWLTQFVPMDAPVHAHIRSNPTFHLPPNNVPLILIGNGTGMAGLRAHLRARDLQGAHRNWLLFGERTRAHDLYFEEDITRWQQTRHLQRLDLAFSRGAGSINATEATPNNCSGARYVQDLLSGAADELRRWLEDGAAIYVCGSREGMAAGVDSTLAELLGSSELIRLREEGRYQRDVY